MTLPTDDRTLRGLPISEYRKAGRALYPHPDSEGWRICDDPAWFTDGRLAARARPFGRVRENDPAPPPITRLLSDIGNETRSRVHPAAFVDVDCGMVYKRGRPYTTAHHFERLIVLSNGVPIAASYYDYILREFGPDIEWYASVECVTGADGRYRVSIPAVVVAKAGETVALVVAFSRLGLDMNWFDRARSLTVPDGLVELLPEVFAEEVPA